MFSSARPIVQATTIKIDHAQMWREWAIKRAVRCYRGDDPRALIEMANAIIQYVAQGADTPQAVSENGNVQGGRDA